jgi:hypothetical protein
MTSRYPGMHLKVMRVVPETRKKVQTIAQNLKNTDIERKGRQNRSHVYIKI